MFVWHTTMGIGCVLKHEPCTGALNDVLVRFVCYHERRYRCGVDENGRRYHISYTVMRPNYECWVGSHELRARYERDKPAFPYTRAEYLAAERQRTLSVLRQIQSTKRAEDPFVDRFFKQMVRKAIATREE